MQLICFVNKLFDNFRFIKFFLYSKKAQPMPVHKHWFRLRIFLIFFDLFRKKSRRIIPSAFTISPYAARILSKTRMKPPNNNDHTDDSPNRSAPYPPNDRFSFFCCTFLDFRICCDQSELAFHPFFHESEDNQSDDDETNVYPEQ